MTTREALSIDADRRVVFEMAEPFARSAPAPLDWGRVPGLRVRVDVALSAPSAVVRLTCATAPADHWVPGVESIVFARATQLATHAFEGPLGTLDAAAIVSHPRGFDQSFAGATADRAVLGRHALTFARGGAEGLLCSAICAGAADACAPTIASLALEGANEGPPAPGVFARSILFAARSPTPSGAALVALALAFVAVLLVKRPRERW